MNLQKRIEKDYEQIENMANNLFQYTFLLMGEKIDVTNEHALQTISAILGIHEEINYKYLLTGAKLESLRHVLYALYDNLSNNLEEIWSKSKLNFDILTRIGVSFLARKATPPWIKVKLDLKKQVSMDGPFDPRMGHFHYTFRNLVDAILKEVQRGSLQSESMHQIMNRVRKFFDKKQAQGLREDNRINFPPFETMPFDQEDINPKTQWGGPVDIQEGFYSLEDVKKYQEMQYRANGWEHRREDPYMSDAMRANNKWLSMLEQMLMSDAIHSVQTGMINIGSEEMGIEDFVWVVSRPQPTCDECTGRDGLTMKEIKSKMKDDYKDQPPPLHPNCRCRVVPKLKDDWADNVLKKDGLEFDPNSGNVYKASKLEKKYGYTDMTMDEYFSLIGR